MTSTSALKKRSFLPLFLLVVLLSFVPSALCEYDIAEDIHTTPFTLHLDFSAPVNLTNVTLYRLNGNQQSRVSEHVGAPLPNSDHTSFSVTVTYLDRDGDYLLYVEKKDFDPPYTPREADYVRFTFVRTQLPFPIELVEPSHFLKPNAAFSGTIPYDITIRTGKPARCKYALTATTDPLLMISFPNETAAAEVHTLPDQYSSETTFVVWCNTTEGIAAIMTFLVGSETTRPTITATATPSTIIDSSNMTTILAVQSNQPVACIATMDATNYPFFPSTTNPENLNAYTQAPQKSIRFLLQQPFGIVKKILVNCTNRAGLKSTVMIPITFKLELTPRIVMTNPGEYTSETDPILTVQVTKGGKLQSTSSCSLADGTPFEKDGNGAFSLDLSDLDDGKHTYKVKCTLTSGLLVEGSLSFIVDTFPPDGYLINGPAVVCGNDPLTVTLSQDERVDPEENFATFAYTILFNGRTKERGSGDGPTIESTFQEEVSRVPGIYTWNVVPQDLAGNNATNTLIWTTEVIKANDTRCDTIPPIITIDATNKTLPLSVKVSCRDRGGSGCTNTFMYDELPAGASKANCTYSTEGTYGDALSFNTPLLFCYYAEDKNRNNVTGAKPIGATSAGSSCANGIRDAGESDRDCGGPLCQQCAVGKSCAYSDDCSSSFCVDGVCIQPSCDDGVRTPGYESDIDCGGFCSACALGKSCGLHADCASKSCRDSICAESSCNDASKNGDETDVDCGGSCLACDVGMACLQDGDCASLQCKNGGCYEAPDVNEPSPSAGFSLVGLTLLIIGALLTCGSGYWLYMLHERSSHSFRASDQSSASFGPGGRLPAPSSTIIPLPPPFTGQRPQFEVPDLAERRRKLEELRRRQLLGAAGSKWPQRIPIKGFSGGAKEPTVARMAARGTATGTESGTGRESDEYLDLSKPAANASKEDSATKPEKSAKVDDAFSKLDSLIAIDEERKSKRRVKSQPNNPVKTAKGRR